MKPITWAALDKDAREQALARSPLINDQGVEASVSGIIEKVIASGDQALIEFNQKFDNFITAELRLSDEQIDVACSNVSPELKQAIEQAMGNISKFHQAQAFSAIDVETMPGVRCELRNEPVDSVGLYIPGGTAPLISTVMMLALPAKIAACRRRVLVSPPPINDAIIYAAKACGITDIYQVGGAQAVAALAFGTESVPKVDKIFGPGNRFVTEAKRLVSQDSRISVAIDMPAGPSEVLVIADEAANPAFVAADLLSQAEHGEDSQVILVTNSEAIANAVSNELATQLEQLPRKDVAAAALKYSRSFIVDDMDQAAELSNQYGPEHLIIQTRAPRDVLKNIRAAGSVFLGPYTPESVGDYASGTNHVLPTYGYSRNYSSLSLADFSRRFTVQELTPSGLISLGDTVMTLASNEQLDAHKNAVAIRLTSLAKEGE
ncbi:histidinol dehydrogenase [Shewanella sp. WXL01]|uniref:histidinol dehydrogenase n=1 Tax=Shewanella sp. WXL01 TaxID=2709721 RepID=UPI0014386D45|nr:histidinol dehydrogenase [Shewanella sp. WXL01]NKF51583.1 histidinol dehydrogenase [Shewanella sp. WXL01]